jgi:hypothetical protein
MRPSGRHKDAEREQNHYHKTSTDFGFAVKQRQTEVKSEYRKKAGKLDEQYHQPGDATTFKSILNEYGRGGEVLGLVVGFRARPRRMFIVSRIW